jgi:surface antigen
LGMGLRSTRFERCDHSERSAVIAFLGKHRHVILSNARCMRRSEWVERAQIVTFAPRRLLMPPHVRARASILLIAGIVVLAEAGTAFAANLGFLRNTPITLMRQRDLQALNDAARVALDTKKDGESLDWNNQGTRNPVRIEGTITPHDTVKDGDRTCRKITLTAVARGQSQSWTPTVCREGSGRWDLQRQ